eukprot:jgi/Picre1/27352/NNA_000319.t2
MDKLNPTFVPVDPNSSDTKPPADPETGVIRRKLSNGIVINYRKTDNEPMGAMVRVVAAGGRALEERGVVALMDMVLLLKLGSSIVGDFDENELEEAALKYLGTVVPKSNAQGPGSALEQSPLVCDPPLEERHSVWHLKDSDERACAYIAGWHHADGVNLESSNNPWRFGSCRHSKTTCPLPPGASDEDISVPET